MLKKAKLAIPDSKKSQINYCVSSSMQSSVPGTSLDFLRQKFGINSNIRSVRSGQVGIQI